MRKFQAEKVIHSHTASRKVKWHRHSGNTFCSFSKSWTQPPYSLVIVFLGIYSRKMKTYGSCKNLFTGFHSMFSWNIPRLKTTQISFHGRMTRQAVVHPHHWMELSNREEWTTNTQQFHESSGNKLVKQKPVCKVYICMILLMSHFRKDTFWKWRIGL